MQKFKSALMWALVWLNVALLVGWALKLTSPQAAAQFRSRGNYLMIPGAVQTANGSAVYVVNTDTGVLGGIFFNDNANRMYKLRPIDLNAAFQSMERTGR
jgi:hypothetical protein